MFGSLGVPELLLIFVVILIVFGPRRIPEIGRTLGKALGEFRKATDDLKSTIEREVRLEELKSIAPSVVTPFESISRTEPATPPAPAVIPPFPASLDGQESSQVSALSSPENERHGVPKADSSELTAEETAEPVDFAAAAPDAKGTVTE
jgi:TatA/E family protein of Tat protein translocase